MGRVDRSEAASGPFEREVSPMGDIRRFRARVASAGSGPSPQGFGPACRGSVAQHPMDALPRELRHLGDAGDRHASVSGGSHGGRGFARDGAALAEVVGAPFGELA